MEQEKTSHGWSIEVRVMIMAEASHFNLNTDRVTVSTLILLVQCIVQR